MKRPTFFDRSRFLDVIRSGALSHEGKFMGQEFTTQERATDVFVNENGRWQCVLSQLTRFIKK
jgi:hypothetical protein